MATAFSDAAPRRSGWARPQDEKRAGGWRLAGFASLFVPITAAQMPLAVHLPAIYAQQFGLSLTVIGAIFLGERLWGAVADPLIGALSDRTLGRFGRRRPWIVAGSALFGVSGALLFFPAASWVSPLYLTVSLFLFYLGWSMVQIPYLAWSGEIYSGYHERTRIATFQTVAGAASLLIVLILPTIIDQISPQDGALKLAAMGSIVLVSLIISLVLTLRSQPEAPAAPSCSARLSLRQTVGAARSPAAPPRAALRLRGDDGAEHPQRSDRLFRDTLYGPASLG